MKTKKGNQWLVFLFAALLLSCITENAQAQARSGKNTTPFTPNRQEPNVPPKPNDTRLERDRLERERLEKERLEKERFSKDRPDKDRLEKDRKKLEQQRLEEEKRKQEQLRLEKERQKHEQLKREQEAKKPLPPPVKPTPPAPPRVEPPRNRGIGGFLRGLFS